MRAGIAIEGEMIILAFGKPVSWVSMTSADARRTAALLLAKADQIDSLWKN